MMQVKDTQDVEKFAQMLRGLVRGHDNTIHMLQAGAFLFDLGLSSTTRWAIQKPVINGVK